MERATEKSRLKRKVAVPGQGPSRLERATSQYHFILQLGNNRVIPW